MRLNQVTIGSTDLERAEQFYRRLGFRLIVKDEHYLRFECPTGDSTFSIELVAAISPEPDVVLYLESDRLDDDFERLRQAGVDFEQPPTDTPWLWREARLRDPDGHRLCLFHGGEARRNPPWRIVET